MSSNISISKICQHCGNEFTARQTVTKFCSNVCAKRAYKQRVRQEKINNTQAETKTIKTKPIAAIQAKDYLSVSEVCGLVGVSRRTIYRMMQKQELNFAKFGKRTIIQRSDIDKVFASPKPTAKPEETKEVITEWVGLSEVQEKYKVSSTALQNIIKRYNIPRLQEGIFIFISKLHIENVFNPKQL